MMRAILKTKIRTIRTLSSKRSSTGCGVWKLRTNLVRIQFLGLSQCVRVCVRVCVCVCAFNAYLTVCGGCPLCASLPCNVCAYYSCKYICIYISTWTYTMEMCIFIPISRSRYTYYTCIYIHIHVIYT
jgi:hypothetical protein